MKHLFLLAGGHRSNDRDPDFLFRSVFTLLGIRSPRIAYVGAASDDDRGFHRRLAGIMRNAGAGDVTLAPTASRSADLTEARAVLERSDAVFMSGGDVEAGMLTLRDAGMLPILGYLYAQGKTFVGISAGSIMLAEAWVRWHKPDDDSTCEVFPCMGFAPILCDTHAESEDWEELRTLLGLTPGSPLGYGIPTGGGLRIDNGGAPVAMGSPLHRFRRVADRIVALSPLLPASDGRPKGTWRKGLNGI